ncbi:hypothetical protein pb186bvf_020632 [Paramecium bursaria]
MIIKCAVMIFFLGLVSFIAGIIMVIVGIAIGHDTLVSVGVPMLVIGFCSMCAFFGIEINPSIAVQPA